MEVKSKTKRMKPKNSLATKQSYPGVPIMEPRNSIQKPYLIDSIGTLIADCLVDCVQGRPADPIDFIAKWLYHYANTRLYFEDKNRMTKELRKVAREEETKMAERKRRMNKMKLAIMGCKSNIRLGDLGRQRSSFMGDLEGEFAFVEKDDIAMLQVNIDGAQMNGERSQERLESKESATRQSARASRGLRVSDNTVEPFDLGEAGSIDESQDDSIGDGPYNRYSAAAAAADAKKKKQGPGIWKGVKQSVMSGLRVTNVLKGTDKRKLQASRTPAPPPPKTDDRKRKGRSSQGSKGSSQSTPRDQPGYLSHTSASHSVSVSSSSSSSRSSASGSSGSWEDGDERPGQESKAWYAGEKSKHKRRSTKRLSEPEEFYSDSAGSESYTEGELDDETGTRSKKSSRRRRREERGKEGRRKRREGSRKRPKIRHSLGEEDPTTPNRSSRLGSTEITPIPDEPDEEKAADVREEHFSSEIGFSREARFRNSDQRRISTTMGKTIPFISVVHTQSMAKVLRARKRESPSNSQFDLEELKYVSQDSYTSVGTVASEKTGVELEEIKEVVTAKSQEVQKAPSYSKFFESADESPPSHKSSDSGPSPEPVQASKKVSSNVEEPAKERFTKISAGFIFANTKDTNELQKSASEMSPFSDEEIPTVVQPTLQFTYVKAKSRHVAHENVKSTVSLEVTGSRTASRKRSSHRRTKSPPSEAELDSGDEEGIEELDHLTKAERKRFRRRRRRIRRIKIQRRLEAGSEDEDVSSSDESIALEPEDFDQYSDVEYQPTEGTELEEPIYSGSSEDTDDEPVLLAEEDDDSVNEPDGVRETSEKAPRVLESRRKTSKSKRGVHLKRRRGKDAKRSLAVVDDQSSVSGSSSSLTHAVSDSDSEEKVPSVTSSSQRRREREREAALTPVSPKSPVKKVVKGKKKGTFASKEDADTGALETVKKDEEKPFQFCLRTSQTIKDEVAEDMKSLPKSSELKKVESTVDSLSITSSEASRPPEEEPVERPLQKENQKRGKKKSGRPDTQALEYEQEDTKERVKRVSKQWTRYSTSRRGTQSSRDEDSTPRESTVESQPESEFQEQVPHSDEGASIREAAAEEVPPGGKSEKRRKEPVRAREKEEEEEDGTSDKGYKGPDRTRSEKGYKGPDRRIEEGYKGTERKRDERHKESDRRIEEGYKGPVRAREKEEEEEGRAREKEEDEEDRRSDEKGYRGPDRRGERGYKRSDRRGERGYKRSGRAREKEEDEDDQRSEEGYKESGRAREKEEDEEDRRSQEEYRGPDRSGEREYKRSDQRSEEGYKESDRRGEKGYRGPDRRGERGYRRSARAREKEEEEEDRRSEEGYKGPDRRIQEGHRGPDRRSQEEYRGPDPRSEEGYRGPVPPEWKSDERQKKPVPPEWRSDERHEDQDSSDRRSDDSRKEPGPRRLKSNERHKKPAHAHAKDEEEDGDKHSGIAKSQRGLSVDSKASAKRGGARPSMMKADVRQTDSSVGERRSQRMASVDKVGKKPRKKPSHSEPLFQAELAEWSMYHQRLLCTHPTLGVMGDLLRIRMEASVADWEEHRYSCQLLNDQEIYTNCETDDPAATDFENEWQPNKLRVPANAPDAEKRNSLKRRSMKSGAK